MALAPADLRALAEEATVVNTDDSMFVELETPWHVYDSTLETGELLRERASGILPVLDEPSVDLGVLSELGIAYARERQLSRAAGVAMSAAEGRGAETLALVRRGYLSLERGGAVAEMQRFLALRPDSPREWSMLASLQQEAGNGAGERLAAANADRAERNVVLQVHRAARWYESQGSVDQAIRTLEFLGRMAPDYDPGRQDLDRLRGSGS